MATLEGVKEPLATFVRYGLVVGPAQGRKIRVDSALRSFDEQIRLRRQNCGTTTHQIYEADPRTCRPITAIAGTSPHETGEAVDIGGDKEWFADLVRPYGVTRPVTGEDWHFEYRGSDPAGDLRRLAKQLKADRLSPAAVAEIVPAGIDFDLDDASLLDQLATVAGGVISTGANAVGLDALSSLGGVLGALTNPDWWRRLGWGALGTAVAALGLVVLFSGLGGGRVVEQVVGSPA